ncbi:MAG: Radical SAM domain protein [Candidatus Scalindua rubra]|uniref:Radical SAM domain protein n=1 Tax=Candidatus Scalindua rubra TaxID=1872076 RepID=A0A1E3XEY9_9BACT|nr:MAG: Radical SAM domain protein [Candidatus Scalindua rubra]
MNKIKCILIDPPSLEVNISDELGLKEDKESLACSPPIGLAYIAASLRAGGFEVKIVDAKSLNMSHKETCKVVLTEKPDLVGITVFTSQLRSALITAGEIKKNLPSCKIVVGGPHVHPQHGEIIREKDFVDFCVRLEGEITVVELARALSEGGDFGGIRGLTFRDADNKVIVNPDRPFIEDLDTLPFPARDLLHNHIYRGSIGFRERARFTYVTTSRGCPFKCRFCSISQFWPRQRRRSVENVLQEMKETYERFQIIYMKFTDEMFVLNKKWVNEFCQGMVDTGLNKKVTWSCDGRVNNVTEELLRNMKEANCAVIFYGIEFGNQKILNDSGKRTKIEDIYRAIEITKKAGISPTGNFMIGYPTETKETINDTMRLAIDLDLDFCSFSVVTPFPGSELYYYCKEKGLLKTKDWEQYNYFHPGESVIRLPDIDDDELMELYRRIQYEYYFRHMKEELTSELAGF